MILSSSEINIYALLYIYVFYLAEKARNTKKVGQATKKQ